MLRILPLAAMTAVAASAPHALRLMVRPAAAMSQTDGNTILLKIRLHEGAQAWLWGAETCAVPSPGAYVIRRSGFYTIPLSAIQEPDRPGVCLVSSDGTLAASLPLAVPKR